ncbi:hypothetical protein BS78_01G367200 [Paspalum vaginatum]|nr:hypothetical protein BS78_01G367200 [Paspalum vaginatum]
MEIGGSAAARPPEDGTSLLLLVHRSRPRRYQLARDAGACAGQEHGSSPRDEHDEGGHGGAAVSHRRTLHLCSFRHPASSSSSSLTPRRRPHGLSAHHQAN